MGESQPIRHMPSSYEEYKQMKNRPSNLKKGRKANTPLESILYKLLSFFPGFFLVMKTLQWYLYLDYSPEETMRLWKVYRGGFYSVYVASFLVIGLIIMIGGQKGKSYVERLLPSLVMSLLFVTFSYAIADLIAKFFGYSTLFSS